ncbi:MAG TPA: hypothetical protein VGM87_05750, partial [Roseomonas sp.]
MPIARRLLAVAGLFFATGTLAADPPLTPLVGEVMAAPRLVPGSDLRRHLVYEVRLANVTDRPAT